jgi:hypothetical protein
MSGLRLFGLLRIFHFMLLVAPQNMQRHKQGYLVVTNLKGLERKELWPHRSTTNQPGENNC